MSDHEESVAKPDTGENEIVYGGGAALFGLALAGPVGLFAAAAGVALAEPIAKFTGLDFE